MKNILITIPLIFGLINAYAQESKPLVAGAKETNRFYYFEIPSAINGSNLDPSAISNVNANFTDSKLSFKLGFPSIFKDAPLTKDLKHSGFIQPSFKATNGISTLYKANSSPVDLGISAGYSRILKHRFWVFLDSSGTPTEDHSSEQMLWLNIIGTFEQGNYNLFTPTTTFGQLIDKRIENSNSIYISINKYFFSEIKRYKIWNNIWSLGIGYAKTNNYASLKNRTLEEGKLAYNNDSSLYQTVVETTVGKNGTFIMYEGLSSFGELFIPILRSKKFGGLYFGNRITFYGIGNANNVANGVTGFYINLKDKKIEGDKPAKDVLNFSVTCQLNQLFKISESDYYDNNFSIVLQAAIPLRFN